MLLEVLGQLYKKCLTLGDGGLGPADKGLLSCGDGIFKVLGCGDRAGPQLFFGSRVRHGVRLFAASQLVVDDVEELGLHGELCVNLALGRITVVHEEIELI